MTRLSLVVLALLLAAGRVAAEGTDNAAAPPMPPTLTLEDRIAAGILRQFPAELQDETLSLINEYFPREAQHFKELQSRNLGDAVAYLTDLIEQAQDLLALKGRDPDLFAKMVRRKDLERQADDLARLCRSVQGERKEVFTQRLRDVLRQLFDVKQELMHADVQHMQRELARLRRLLEQRADSREEIVDRRLADLVETDRYLDW